MRNSKVMVAGALLLLTVFGAVTSQLPFVPTTTAEWVCFATTTLPFFVVGEFLVPPLIAGAERRMATIQSESLRSLARFGFLLILLAAMTAVVFIVAHLFPANP
jgi:hypothetical protein